MLYNSRLLVIGSFFVSLSSGYIVLVEALWSLILVEGRAVISVWYMEKVM
jgi:hypothetical protein